MITALEEGKGDNKEIYRGIVEGVDEGSFSVENEETSRNQQNEEGGECDYGKQKGWTRTKLVCINIKKRKEN